eukprot:scaffold4973_cov135-Cylindrotheca_fusiformis.AAC.28
MTHINEAHINEEERRVAESCGSLAYSRESSSNSMQSNNNGGGGEEEVKQIRPSPKMMSKENDTTTSSSVTIPNTIVTTNSTEEAETTSPPTTTTTTNPSPAETVVRAEYVERKRDFEDLLDHVTSMIMDYYDECGRPTETQLHDEFLTPAQILAKMKPIHGQILPGSNEDCLNDIRVVFRHSLKTMHPFFLDKLYFGSDPIGQIAELIVAVLNGTTHVYHVSPVFSTMEIETILWMGTAFGLRKEDIDGTMNPGGSMSNRMALILARNEYFPHVKEKGWKSDDRPVGFTAVQSHYSITTAAMVAGMGTDNMIQVPAIRETSQMDPGALELRIQQEIEKGNKPFFVNAVAGTTVMGAFDDLKAIGEICKRYKLWFHVDACWGGFLIFSSPENKAGKFDGIELADSISFNPHKALGVPQQCSMLITNKKSCALGQSNGSDAEYLFQPQNGGYDIGNKTLGCGRKADALKFWLTIRKHGLDGFRQLADHAMEKARRLTKLIQESEDFELVAIPMGTNVCYWYTPSYFVKNPEEYTHPRKAAVHQIIFNRMKEQGGRCLIQQQPLKEFGLPNFFRLAFGGDKARLEDLDFLLNETRRLGQDITPLQTDAT